VTLYTIGHSDLSYGEFLTLLRAHDILTVVDARSAPYSRHAPQFSRTELEPSLRHDGLRYVFEGKALGGRPDEPDCYRKGAVPPGDAEYLDEVDYAAVMRKPWFAEGIARLLEAGAHAPTAVLCSEADPKDCHRHHLIATHVNRRHPEVTVLHITLQGVFDARQLGSRADDRTAIQPSLF
jgi:uncharacterized protein (DUF488 family)